MYSQFRQNNNSAQFINADQYYHFSNMIKMDQLLEGFYQNYGADSKYFSSTSIIFEQQDEQLLSSSKEQRTRIIKNKNQLQHREHFITPKKRNGRKFENSNCQKTDINKKKRKFQQPQQKQMPSTQPRAEKKNTYVRIDDLLHQLTSTNQSNHVNSHNLFEQSATFKQPSFHGYQPQKEKSSFDQYRQNLSSWSPKRKNQYIHSGQNRGYNGIQLNSNRSYKLFQQAPSVQSRQYQYQNESLLNPYVSDHKKYYPPYNRQQKGQNFNTKKKIAMYVPVSRETTFHKGQRSSQQMSTHKSHSRLNSNISNRSKSRSPPPISAGKKANSRSFYQIPQNPKLNNKQEMNDENQNYVKSNHNMLAKFERQILSQPQEQEREVSDYNFSEVKNNRSFNIEKKQRISESTYNTKHYHNKTASMHRIEQKQTIHESEYQSTKKNSIPSLDNRVRETLTYLSEVRAPPHPIPIQIKK